MRTYTASEIGNCTTALVARQLGYKPGGPSAKLQKAYDQGHENEQRILEAWEMLDESYELTSDHGLEIEKEAQHVLGQPKVRLVLDPEFQVVAHLDGVGYIDNEGFNVLEAKAFAPSTFATWQRKGFEAFDKYAWQVSVQIEASGLPCRFIVGVKDEDGVVQEVHETLVRDAPYSVEQIRARIMEAEAWVMAGQVPDCITPSYPCSFSYLPQHPEREVEQVNNEELRLLAEEYYTISQEIKDLEAKKAGLKPKLQALLTDEAVDVGGYEVKWVRREMPERTLKASTQEYPSVKYLG